MNYVDKLTTAFLAFLFAFAGMDKLIHLEGFVNAINSYRVLPIPMGEFLAPLVIAVELTIVVGLLRRGWRSTAALTAAALLVLLTGALLANKLLGVEGTCGCWFSVNMAQGDMHFVLNAIMILMSLSVWHASSCSLEQKSPGSLVAAARLGNPT